jgi:ABC-type sugar transport system substrate-binding protein
MTQNSARLQAGLDKVRIQIAIAGEKQDPRSQADLVRTAVARKPLALVVEPADPADPDLAEAVARARERGIVVVVVAHPLTAPESGPSKSPDEARRGGPVIRVVPESFATSAKALVAAAANNARNAKLALEAGAILAVDTTSDPLVEDRVRALVTALRDAGIRLAHEVRYAGDSNEGEKKLDDLLEGDRKACIVLGADVTSTRGAYALTSKKAEKRPYVVAGYTADESEASATRMGEYAGIAAFSADRLIRKAVATANLAAAGQKFPEQVEMLVPIHVSPANSAGPRMYEMKKSRQ